MPNYNEIEFKSFFWKGKLKEAMVYLSEIPEKRELYKRYVDVFINRNLVKRTDNSIIDQIDRIYQCYYHDIFWVQLSIEVANTKLFQALHEFCGLTTDSISNSDIEQEVAKLVMSEGYSFLCGVTQGIFGPYIWKDSEEIIYEVDLPTGKELYKVIMLEGFISRSWMDYISMGLTGTGGWAKDDGTLCCVKQCYDLQSDHFLISFLKHEAQHAYDKRVNPDITSEELEYRAKLVELVYWNNDEKIKSFLREADLTNITNTHAMAAYRIIRGLSERIFECEFQSDEKAWHNKTALIQKLSLEMLMLGNNEMPLM